MIGEQWIGGSPNGGSPIGGSPSPIGVSPNGGGPVTFARMHLLKTCAGDLPCKAPSHLNEWMWKSSPIWTAPIRSTPIWAKP